MSWDLCFSGEIYAISMSKFLTPVKPYSVTSHALLQDCNYTLHWRCPQLLWSACGGISWGTNMSQQKSQSALLPAVCSRGALWACSGWVLWLHKESSFIFNKMGNTARVCAYEWIWIVCLRLEGTEVVTEELLIGFIGLYSLHAVHIRWLYDHVNSYLTVSVCITQTCVHWALRSQQGWLTFLKFLFICFSVLNCASVIVTAVIVCQCFGWKTGGCLLMRRS